VKVVKDKKSTPDALGYELEELKLVGVLKSDKGMMAMMEDTQGKGIFFRKGDPINQNMWVADISNSNVVFAYKLKGEIKKVVVDLPIKK
jgi:Tfp pilus assembly protein PilP